METDKDIGHKRSQRSTHRDTIDMSVDVIVEAEGDRMVAISHSTKITPRNDWGFTGPQYKMSAQISIVSSSGTFVNKLYISKGKKYAVSIGNLRIKGAI